MNQETKFSYTASPNEQITLKFSFKELGQGNGQLAVVHSHDPDTSINLNPGAGSTPDDPVYRFSISPTANDLEAVVYQCTFQGTVGENARVELILQGSDSGEEEFTGPTVCADNKVKKKGLRFKI